MEMNTAEDWEVNLSDGIKVFKDKILNYNMFVCEGCSYAWSVCIIING